MALDKDFAWGVACSAYQTEGAENEDGRGESIWDSKFTKGKTLGDMNGKIACDHYHRYKELSFFDKLDENISVRYGRG